MDDARLEKKVEKLREQYRKLQKKPDKNKVVNPPVISHRQTVRLAERHAEAHNSGVV